LVLLILAVRRIIAIVGRALAPVLARGAGDRGDGADDQQPAEHVAGADPVVVAIAPAAVAPARFGRDGAETDRGDDNRRRGGEAGQFTHRGKLPFGGPRTVRPAISRAYAPDAFAPLNRC